MSTDFQLRDAVEGQFSPTSDAAAAALTRNSIELIEHEDQLLAEIDRLRYEVGRLSRKLVEERADRAVQRQVHTVLSSLYCSPTVSPPDERRGHDLGDGRFIPEPITVGGTRRSPEPGLSSPATDTCNTVANGTTWQRGQEQMTALTTDCADDFEFAPDDESATAFDRFMTAHDPHLARTRQFLLD